MKPLATVPFVCAIWLDAHGRAVGEFTAEEITREFHRPMPIKTFGLLICDNEQGLTIAQEITSEEDGESPTYRGLGFIPRGMLKELIPLDIPRRKRTRTPKKSHADHGTPH